MNIKLLLSIYLTVISSAVYASELSRRSSLSQEWETIEKESRASVTPVSFSPFGPLEEHENVLSADLSHRIEELLQGKTYEEQQSAVNALEKILSSQPQAISTNPNDPFHSLDVVVSHSSEENRVQEGYFKKLVAKVKKAIRSNAVTSTLCCQEEASKDD